MSVKYKSSSYVLFYEDNNEKTNFLICKSYMGYPVSGERRDWDNYRIFCKKKDKTEELPDVINKSIAGAKNHYR